jgi:hypothetical protein
MKPSLFLVFTLTLGSATMLAQQSAPPHHPDARGQQVMGFDQQKATHHFWLFEDGGAIEVTVKDPHDDANLKAIRAHLPEISHMFADGRFEQPMHVHDTKEIPGIADMGRLKDQIKYTYTETKTGGRVDIVTTDKAALAAVHAFLKYQITEHQTGDPLKPGHRKH